MRWRIERTERRRHKRPNATQRTTGTTGFLYEIRWAVVREEDGRTWNTYATRRAAQQQIVKLEKKKL